MKFPTVFKDTDPANWRDATYWLSYSLLGGLAPIWSGIIVSAIFSHSSTLGQFTRHGEFAIYTAAILAPAFHTLSRDLKLPGFKGRQFLSLASLCFMFIATCMYVAVSSSEIAHLTSDVINEAFVKWATLGLFIVATAVTYFITVLDYSRLSTDLGDVVAAQQQDLKNEFNHLQGSQS